MFIEGPGCCFESEEEDGLAEAGAESAQKTGIHTLSQPEKN